MGAEITYSHHAVSRAGQDTIIYVQADFVGKPVLNRRQWRCNIVTLMQSRGPSIVTSLVVVQWTTKITFHASKFIFLCLHQAVRTMIHQIQPINCNKLKYAQCVNQ